MMQMRIGISIMVLAGLASGQWPETANKPDPVRERDAPPASIRQAVEKWPECDEYISKSPCRVTVNMSNLPQPDKTRGPFMPRAHWDVQVKPFIHLKAVPRGEAAVLLVEGSPFMKCMVSATPAAPTRDLSASIGSLLTAVAGMGAIAPGVGGGEKAFAEMAIGPAPPAAAPPVATGISDLDKIEMAIARISAEETVADQKYGDIRTAYEGFRTAFKKDWKYTFPDPDAAQAAIDDLKAKVANVRNSLDAFIELPIKIAKDLDGLDKLVAAFDPGILPPELAEKYLGDRATIALLNAHIDTLKDHLSDFGDNRKLVVQVDAFLAALDDKSAYTEQALPMSYFSGKTVTETVSCKDAMTKDQATDNIVFTAYYESLPHWDISVGAIGSLLGGRQVGAITAPYTPAQATACAAAAAAAPSGSPAPVCGPSTLLGYTTKSAYQFMPGIFVEERIKNFRCPWAENGEPWHPVGYLCSIGLAGGVAINPNNGGPAAEFFEGVSFGIQRFAFLIGFHNGRYQQFGGGYYAGEVFPPGTTVTPPTTYGWATHPAFGIAYRIPPR